MRAALDRREPFKYNFNQFSVMYIWERCCFCCCRGSKAVKDYRKFQVARERLGKEIDLYHLIKLTRVNRMLLKMLLKRKHRHTAWVLPKERCITDADIKEAPTEHPWCENTDRKQIADL